MTKVTKHENRQLRSFLVNDKSVNTIDNDGHRGWTHDGKKYVASLTKLTPVGNIIVVQVEEGRVVRKGRFRPRTKLGEVYKNIPSI